MEEERAQRFRDRELVTLHRQSRGDISNRGKGIVQ